MPHKELTANELIAMGSDLLIMLNPRQFDVNQYRSAISDIIGSCNRAGFNVSHGVAEALLVDFGDTNAITYQSRWPGIAGTAKGMGAALQRESSAKTLILTDAKPPSAIAQLTGLQPHQQALLEDMVTCLKAHLARPAIVMAWTLGYDIVRSWVFEEQPRLDAFNVQYANEQNKQNPKQIKYFSDFFKMKESAFILICRNSQHLTLKDFTDNEERDMVALLDKRNKFAHANFHKADIHEAGAYISEMVRLVANPPFYRDGKRL